MIEWLLEKTMVHNWFMMLFLASATINIMAGVGLIKAKEKLKSARVLDHHNPEQESNT